ncbi:hypothetical protein [Brevundimonas sp.]|uniref:DUF6968 family protein n=1 Tax=Brevundimonas sp. TaxID=1871086 RepID=UPI0035281E7B
MTSMDSASIEYSLLITPIAGGEPRNISVVIFPPRVVDGNAYECRYQICGIDRDPVSIFGSTPIQAVQLALKIVSVELIGVLKSYHIVDASTGAAISRDLIQLGT